MGIHELMVGAVGDLEPKLYPFIAFYDYDPEVNPDQSDKSWREPDKKVIVPTHDTYVAVGQILGPFGPKIK